MGDPVDTLTGAVTDRMLDFRLTGPIELRWYRHYDSAQSHRSFSIGRGCAHEYDRSLSIDAEGLRYEEPVGKQSQFPPLRTDGDACKRHGLTLRRIAANRYSIASPGRYRMEFLFAPGAVRARLSRLVHGTDQVRFVYDAAGQLSTIIDSTGRRIAATEDSACRLVHLAIERSGGQTEHTLIAYQYDGSGNLVAARYPAGHFYAFAYDEAHRMVLRRGRKGFRFRFKYDEQGRCVLAMGDDRLYGVALEYTIPGRVTHVTHPDMGRWTYRFGATGNLQEVHDPLGGVQKYIRDEFGRLAAEIDPNGNATRLLYDAAGAPIGKLDPLGHRVPVAPPPMAPAPGAHRVAANAAEYEFGAILDPNQIALPDAHQVRSLPLAAEIRALVWERRDPPDLALGAQFRVAPIESTWWPRPRRGWLFNDLGELVAQHDDLGRLRRWTYDVSGNRAAYTDFDGGTWQYNYGSWHFLPSIVNPLGAEIRFTYTTGGNVASCIDPAGTTSEYAYNKKDRLIEVRRHGIVRDRYLADAAGNLVAKYDGHGQTMLQFEIGAGNQPIRCTLASGDEHSFRYDPAGRPLVVTTNQDRIEFQYDPSGNRVQDLRNGIGVQHQFVARGKPARSSFFNRFVVRYERRGNILAITDPRGIAHELQFHANGIVERRMGNGSTETAQYDGLGRCLFKFAQRRGPAWRRRYHWSGEGELRRVEDNHFGDSVNAYDAAHRLRRHASGGRTAHYQFDDADNLLAQPGLEGTGFLAGNRLCAANGAQFEYNARNHIAVRVGPAGETRYFYDSRDQLVRAETPQGVWAADYDPLGRRTRKHWRGETTHYYWSTDQLAAELRHDGSLRLYVYADPLALSPTLLLDYDAATSEPESARAYIVFSDQVGTPCLIEDQQQREVWRARVAPFGGAEIAPGASIAFHLRFPGHYFDAELGLHLNRFRYYDPMLGRYIQSDPWGISGGFNLYAYRTNPLGDVDVRGLGGGGPEEEPPPEGGPPAEEGANGAGAGDGGHSHGEDPSAFPGLTRGGGDTDAHADRVVSAIQDAKPPLAQNRSVTVIEHEDGTVSVGLSKGNDQQRSAAAQQVVNDLNTQYPPEPGDPPTYRTADINRDRPLNDGGSREDPQPMPWNCSEAQASQAAGTHPDSPPQNYQTVWTGPAENPEPYQMPGRPTTPGGNEQMAPCRTCQSNADNYNDMSNGRPPPAGGADGGEQ